MKRRLFVLLFISALLLALVTIAAACGGNGGLTLEEYFERLDTLSSELEEDSDRLTTEFDQAVSEAETEEEVIDAFRDFSASLTELFADVVAGLESLDPPSEVKDAHNELVAAEREGRDLLEDLDERAQRAESVSDVEDWSAEFEGPEYAALSDRTTQACLALQELADANDIDIDLECEG